MMGKDSTTSQLDFLLLEEVSDQAAEVISGGIVATLGGLQEIEVGLFDPLTLPLDLVTDLAEALNDFSEATGFPGLTEALSPITGSLPGVEALPLPAVEDLLGGLPI